MLPSANGIAARNTIWLAESSRPWKFAVYQSFSWNDISDAVGSVALAASSSSFDRSCADAAIGIAGDNSPAATRDEPPGASLPIAIRCRTGNS